jgi:hypothetical protein
MRRGPHVRQLGAALAATLASKTALAFDPFEIQVYDGLVNGPGVPGIELHINTVPAGLTTAEPPELPPHGQSHFTLEPTLGLTPWWELGAYLQTALRQDGTFTYAGTKLRTKFAIPRGWDPHWQLAINVEFAVLPEAYDRDRWGNEVRFIAGWENATWIFMLNPMLDTPLAGEGLPEGPSLVSAATAKFKIQGKVAVGLEYYGDYGPLADLSPWAEQAHYLFEAFDLLSVARLELNAGVGEGVTAASNGLVLKAIVGYTWE